MSPVVPYCSIANILLYTGTTPALKCSARCNWLRMSPKHTLHFVPSPPPAMRPKAHILSATGTDETLEISEPPKSDESASVKNEDLVPGATFTGKVRSIQPFGAFVDIGAFTDGLVHVSRLSDGYVKDVGSIVSVGQEVKVRLVEVNLETKRIGLSMREGDDGPSKKGPPRPNVNQKKMSKLAPGEMLVGTVKNLTRSGAFVTLPGEEEGFLPESEGNDPLAVGQEVNVKVLRMNRGKVTLTMKEEGAGEKIKLDVETEYSDGVDYVRTNPFMRAFRKNKDISMLLDEREASKVS